MTTRNERFIYSAENVPIGGQPGDVLVKIQGANYYTAWRNLTEVIENYDVIFDDGDY